MADTKISALTAAAAAATTNELPINEAGTSKKVTVAQIGTALFLPVFARVTGSDATTTGTSLVDVTGLSVALVANAVYGFTANLCVSSSSTAGCNYAMQYSAAGAALEAGIHGGTNATSNHTARMVALNTAYAGPYCIISGSTTVLMQGVVTTGANTGNLTVQHQKITSGTSTVRIQSYLKVTRIA